MSVDELIHCAGCDTWQHMRSGCCPKCLSKVNGNHDISVSNEVTARIRERRIMELIDGLEDFKSPRFILMMYIERWQDDDISQSAITNKLKRMSERGNIERMKVGSSVLYSKVR